MTNVTPSNASNTYKGQVSTIVDGEFDLQEWTNRSKGKVTAAKFGVIGSGAVDDSAALEDAMNTAPGDGKELELVGSQGNSFLVDATISISVPALIKGTRNALSGTRTVFMAAQDNLEIVVHNNADTKFLNRSHYSDIQFHANGKHNVVGFRHTGADAALTMDRIGLYGLRTGIWLDGSQFCTLNDIGAQTGDNTGTTVAILQTPWFLANPSDPFAGVGGGGNNVIINTATLQSYDIGMAMVGYRGYFTKWQANHTYAVGDIAIPTDPASIPGKWMYVSSITTGISDSSEPAWGTVFVLNGTTYIDGGVTWTVYDAYPFGGNKFLNVNALTCKLTGYYGYDVDTPIIFEMCTNEGSGNGTTASKTLFNNTVQRSAVHFEGCYVKFEAGGLQSTGPVGPIIKSTPYINHPLKQFSSSSINCHEWDMDPTSEILLTGSVSMATDGIVPRNVTNQAILSTKNQNSGCFLSKNTESILDYTLPNHCYIGAGGNNAIVPGIDVSGIASNIPTLSIDQDAALGSPVKKAVFGAVAGSSSSNAVRVYSRTSTYSGIVPYENKMAVTMMIKASVACELRIEGLEDTYNPYLEMDAGIWYRLFYWTRFGNHTSRSAVMFFYPVDTSAPTVSFCRINSMNDIDYPGLTDEMIGRLARGHFNPGYLNDPWIWRTNAAPTTGTWAAGSFVRNESAGSLVGYRTAAGGSPGTWVSVTLIV